MTSSKEIIEQASNLLIKLEKSIENKTISDAHLPLIQDKLDEMDRELKRSGYSEPDIHILYEIQVLIYGEQNQDEKLKDCLGEAVRIAGSPEALSSSLLRDYAKSSLPIYIPFVQRSLVAVFLLSLFTLGLYSLIWFEKNWRAVKKAKPQKMWPFWRAIFSWFWAWPLFKEMTDYARTREYVGKIPSSGLLAFFRAANFLDQSFGNSTFTGTRWATYDN